MKRILFSILIMLTVQSVANAQNVLEFDGVNDYLFLSSNNRNITTEVSVACWVKSSVTGTTQFITSKYNGGGGFTLYFDVNGKAAIDGRDGSGTYKSTGPSTTSVNDGQWHYLTGTINITSGTWSIYVDGVLENTANLTAGTTLACSEILVAGMYYNTGVSYFFTGAIDNISYWNLELDQASIEWNMNNCLNGTETGIVGLYNLNEGTGTTVTDESPSLINGSLENMDPSTDWVAGSNSNCISGINDISMESMNIYPNPTKSQITIDTDEIIQEVLVFDIFGSLVQTENTKTFTIENLASGIYQISIKTKSGIIKSRFIKE